MARMIFGGAMHASDNNNSRGPAFWLNTGIVAVAILMAATVAVSVRGISNLYHAQEQVLRSQQSMLGLERLLSLAKDAETGQRGYLLTGDEQYLKPYRDALAAFEQQWQSVERSVHDGPAQRTHLARLKELFAAKFEELAMTVATRRERGLAAAQQLVITNRGKQTMDAARAETAAINEEEENLLRVREAARTIDRRNAIASTFGAGLLGIVMCTSFGFLLRRHYSARERAAAATFAQKELYRTTLASIGDAVITTDVHARVTSLNTVAQTLTGWPQDDAAGQPLESVFNIINEHSRARVDNPATRALRDGAIVGLANHTLLIARDGRQIPIDDSAAPIRDSAGCVTGAVLVFRDITERKHAETALREGDRRKDEFLATLAHELRNPLAPLRNALQLARVGDGAALRQGPLLEMMDRQVGQMTRLVDDLLDIARVTRGKLALRVEPTNIAGVVEQALETCAPFLKQGRHVVATQLPREPVYVEGDATRLAQVVCNLLNNAAKFSAPGADIRLAVSREDATAVLSVKDRGIGIAAHQLHEVFEMFSQLDRSLERTKTGLGIGLTLSRQIVEMHGGTIEALSEGPGHGAEFVVRLPATGRPPMAADQPPAVADDGSKRKILVADDNRDSADSLGMLLRLAGHDVQVAYDGSAAIAVANTLEPDVILLDIGMPKMNGYDAARNIRRQPWSANTVLIALTGWGQTDDKLRAQQAGFDRHLVKPVDSAELAAALQVTRDAPF